MAGQQLFQAAQDRQVESMPLSSLYLGDCPRGGLVLGFSRVLPDHVRPGVERLAQAFESATNNAGT